MKDLKSPSGVASALCYRLRVPLASGFSPPSCSPPVWRGKQLFQCQAGLTAPPLLSHGINSRNQLPTAAGYSLSCKPREWAESTAWARAGATLQNSWDLGRAQEKPPRVSRLSPPHSSCHRPAPPLLLFLLCFWSSCWPPTIWFEEILPGNLEAKAAAVQRLHRGRNIIKYNQQNPFPRGLG